MFNSVFSPYVIRCPTADGRDSTDTHRERRGPMESVHRREYVRSQNDRQTDDDGLLHRLVRVL